MEKTYVAYLTVRDEMDLVSHTCRVLESHQKGAQSWWDDLTDEQKQVFYDLPNFDKEKFEKCVGIKI